jgi:hypothetical protein
LQTRLQTIRPLPPRQTESPFPGPFMVGGTGLEPVTPSLSSSIEDSTRVAKRGLTRILRGFIVRWMDSSRPISTGVADTMLTKPELQPLKRFPNS